MKLLNTATLLLTTILMIGVTALPKPDDLIQDHCFSFTLETWDAGRILPDASDDAVNVALSSAPQDSYGFYRKDGHIGIAYNHKFLTEVSPGVLKWLPEYTDGSWISYKSAPDGRYTVQFEKSGGYLSAGQRSGYSSTPVYPVTTARIAQDWELFKFECGGFLF